MQVGLVCHPDYLKHHAGQQHPERPSRLEAVMQALDASHTTESMTNLDIHHDAEAWIAKVHELDHIHTVAAACQHDRAALDPDTVVCRESYAAALKAVAGTLAAADAVMAGELPQAFCAVRPPGHHAEAHKAMGFCLFNNVAILARYLQLQHGVDNVLIVDWDVHHGNGTQHIFEDDSSVLYISTHQYPYYPGTGAVTETGQGNGKGFTMNFPLPPGSDDAVYLDVFEQHLLPRALEYRPDVVLVSAGFDAHRDDPLAQMRVTETGYRRMTQVVKQIAATCSGKRLISVLEGGYDLDALGRSVTTHVNELQRDN